MSTSRKRSRRIFDSDNDLVRLNVVDEEWTDGDVNNHTKEDEDMPIQQTTNPISSSSMMMMYNMIADEMNDCDEMTSLKGLKSLGGSCFDIQADVSIIKKTKKKSDSSVLVILPGRLQPHRDATDDITNNTQVKIGRIEGFQNFDGKSPNHNHLTLSLGGSLATTTNDTTTASTNSVTAEMAKESLNDESITASTSAPTIQFRGRTMPTTTTFVLLHVTGGNNTKTGTTTSNNKRTPTKMIKPKVVCKGVFNNVIVFGQGTLIKEEEARTTTATPISARNSDSINVQLTPTTVSDEIPESVRPLPTLTSSDSIQTTDNPTGIAGDRNVAKDEAILDVENNAIADHKSLPASQSPPPRRSNARRSKMQLLPSSQLHSAEIRMENECSPMSSSHKEKETIPIVNQSNSLQASTEINDKIATTAVTSIEVTTAHTTTSPKRRRPQREHEHLQNTIDSIPVDSDMTPTRSKTAPPSTMSVIVANKVRPGTVASSLSPQPHVTKTTDSSCNSSNRKRRRYKNIDSTKSPNGNEKNPFVINVDDDDEFAFLGG